MSDRKTGEGGGEKGGEKGSQWTGVGTVRGVEKV